MSDGKAIALVREHRWMSADRQAAVLRATGVAAVYSLKGGKRIPSCTLEDVRKWATVPGRVFRLVHLFLLPVPARHTPVLRKRLKALVIDLVDNRDAVLEDVDSGLSTAVPGQRRALLALANEDIARSCRGYRGATNGALMAGRQFLEFTEEQLTEAKRIWRDTIDYPLERDAADALAGIQTRKREKFTRFRARRLWGSRKSGT